jgi:hypothetical protein
MSEDEFYEIVKSHEVSPHKMGEIELLKKNSSNIVPKDIDDWKKKFPKS